VSDLIATALFPTFLFTRDHGNPDPFNRQLVAHGERLQELDPQGVQISNRGGWQSKDDLHRQAQFADFVGFIEETLAEVKAFLHIADDVTLRIFACWMNINREGHFNVRHVHGNSIFSGAYYVQAPYGSGGIKIFDPNPVRDCFHAPYQVIDSKNCFYHEADSVAGRVLIFPGYVPHEVAENRSGEVRISMSFNVGLA
jgi:uncharacterized protein (TIGR02466 family)